MKFSRSQIRYIPSKIIAKSPPADSGTATPSSSPNLPLSDRLALRQIIVTQNYLREQGIIRRLNLLRKINRYVIFTFVVIALFCLILLVIDAVCNAPLHEAWDRYLSRENTFDVTSLLESYDVVYNPGNEDERNVYARITISYDNCVLLSENTIDFLTHPVILIRSPSGILHVDWLDIGAIRHSININKEPYTIYIPFSTGNCTGLFGRIHAFIFSLTQHLTLFFGFTSIVNFAMTSGFFLVALSFVCAIVDVLICQYISIRESSLKSAITNDTDKSATQEDTSADHIDPSSLEN